MEPEFEEVRALMLIGDTKSCFLSNPMGMMQCAEEHGKVLFMGSPVVPSLLSLLESEEGNTHVIFMMLRLLARKQPEIPHELRGKVEAIKQLWLKLGRKEGWI